VAGRCGGGLVPVAAGARVPPWRLGAIDFLSAGLGLALTAAEIPCQDHGTEFVPAQVRLAVSRDGGHSWVTQGAVLSPGGREPGAEQIAAVSARRAWALTAAGQLLLTRDAGAAWTVQPLPAPVLGIGKAGGTLWALSCPRLTGLACRPVLERYDGGWRRWPVPPRRSGAYWLLAALSSRAAVFLVSRAGSAAATLVSTGDAGRHWTRRPAPRGPVPGHGRGGLCQVYAGIASAGPRRWWLLCDGDGAAGQDTSALMTTADAGRTWHTAASVRSILAAPPPGSLPYQEPLAIAAGPAGRLWLATANGLAASTGAGARWAAVPGVDPQGARPAFDVLSARQAWLLAPGVGLWSTSDGSSWHPAGPAWPGLAPG
jgi:photosystem II stability/assembly factor-like uncharacterized protein